MAEEFSNIESVRVLYEISTLIQSDSKLEEMFERALRLIRDTIGCHSASLFIYNEESGKLDEVSTIGVRVDLIKAIDFDMGKGFSAWVAKNRRSVLLPNLRKEHHKGFRSFISTPLISKNRLIGVINLGHKEPDSFTEKHKEFLEIIASQLANTIERTNFEQELLKKNEALVKAQKEILDQQKKIVEMEKYQVLVQVAASINHEINNPLTTIIGNAELLLMSQPDLDEKLKKRIDVILKEAKRIAKIVEKLKNIKKIVIEDYITDTGEKMIDIESSNS